MGAVVIDERTIHDHAIDRGLLRASRHAAAKGRAAAADRSWPYSAAV